MLINKNTKIFGSFSKNPGNNGCNFFNNLFEKNNIDAIYKSFYSDDIKKSLEACKTLNFAGFAISMPFKVEVIKYLDEIDDCVSSIGACNTVLNINGHLKGYNTDWLGVYNYFLLNSTSFINILGNGGFSKSAQYALTILNIPYRIITRDKWYEIPTLIGTIFNCSPIEVISKNLVDGRPFTSDGKKLAELQAIEQYKLYIMVM